MSVIKVLALREVPVALGWPRDRADQDEDADAARDALVGERRGSEPAPRRRFLFTHPDAQAAGRTPALAGAASRLDAVPEELLALAPEREPAIVLTAPWHERDTRTLVARLGASVFAPPPDTAQDLMNKYGITTEQAGDGSGDLQWLRSGGGEVHWCGAGDRLPIGIAAYAGREHNDLVLWNQNVRAVIAGDSLVDFGSGLALNEWLRSGVTRRQVVEGLRPLLDLPVEAVCPAHGPPTDRAALERALSL